MRTHRNQVLELAVELFEQENPGQIWLEPSAIRSGEDTSFGDGHPSLKFKAWYLDRARGMLTLEEAAA